MHSDDFVCPYCRSGPIRVAAICWATLTAREDVVCDVTNVEWFDDSVARCANCQHTSDVEEFRNAELP